MNNYRTASLFHYTSKIETIKKILCEGLKPNFAKEEFLDKTLVVGIPMISFCDIPITRTAVITRYGEYCIGFSKEWCIDKKFRPVQYFFGNYDKVLKIAKITEEQAKIDYIKSLGNADENGRISINKENIKPLHTFSYLNNAYIMTRAIFGYSKPYIVGLINRTLSHPIRSRF